MRHRQSPDLPETMTHRQALLLAFLTTTATACQTDPQSDAEADAADPGGKGDYPGETPDEGAFVVSSEHGPADARVVEFRDKSIDGAEMFARGAFAEVGMERMPFVMFRILPELAQRIDGYPTFGEADRAFEEFGYFYDGRKPQWPAPLGFTWTVPELTEVSYVMRTCASCHVSRVELDGELEYLEGAGNHEMEFHAFTTAWVEFVERALHPDAREATKVEILDLIASKPTDWFFNGQASFDATGTSVVFDESRAAAQVAMFVDDIDATLEQVYSVNRFRGAVSQSITAAFASAPENPQPYDIGPAGIADTNSNGIHSIVTAHNLSSADNPFPTDSLYRGATKVSIPSVWQQGRRTAAQWTASVTDLFFRNAIAAMGFGSDAKDLNALHLEIVSAYISELPPPPYPGEIDEERAAAGRLVYEDAKCGQCHVADHADLTTPDGFPEVFKIGTSPNRSRSATPGLGELVGGALFQVCSHNGRNATLSVTIDGEVSKPCKVDPTKITLSRVNEDETGYPAMPLDGVWGRAPYLHNGSVPTLYHLLASQGDQSVRPDEFEVGSRRLDTDKVGWQWSGAGTGVYDTTLDGFSNGGHDGFGRGGYWTDESGESFRLTWDVDDPEQAQELANLLEYLKTL